MKYFKKFFNKKNLLIVSLTPLMAFYQNCEEIHPVSLNQVNPVQESEIIGTLAASENLRFRLSSSDSLSSNLNWLVLDLENGTLHEESDSGDLIVSYCPDNTDIQPLIDVLTASEICDFSAINTSESDIFCAMIYHSPYAVVLSKAGESLALGEKSSSCGAKIDLCEPNQTEFKSLLRTLVDQLNLISCS